MASRPRISRQRWSEASKKRVVAEANVPGMTVAQIARRYDLDGRRISNWMKKFSSASALVPLVDLLSEDACNPHSNQHQGDEDHGACRVQRHTCYGWTRTKAAKAPAKTKTSGSSN